MQHRVGKYDSGKQLCHTIACVASYSAIL